MPSGVELLLGVHPTVRAYALYAADAFERIMGAPVRFTSGLRSREQQSRLRADYLAGRSPYPANEPGDSAHEYGLAFDSVVPDPLWWAWTLIRTWVGFSVPSNDRVHAEVPSWRRYVGVS
jgi:hypothetical protein